MNFPTPAAAQAEKKIKDKCDMRSVHSDGAVSLYILNPPTRIYIKRNGDVTNKLLKKAARLS